jgi:hypothetical protein
VKIGHIHVALKFSTAFDISSTRDLSSSRMTEGDNCHKEARSAGPAKKEILIPKKL